MSIRLRKRGDIWHARGTIRVGRQTIEVPQFSTGSRTRADAEAIAAAEEAKIRQEHVEGPAGRQNRLTLADCFLAYLRRPGGLKSYDQKRVGDLARLIGSYSVASLAEAWGAWLDKVGYRQAPATVARTRSTLQAALNAGCTAQNAGPAPKVPTVRQPKGDRVVYLSDQERVDLLAAYSPAAGRVAKILAYQGLRTQEALQLDWRAVSLKLGTIRVVDTESKTRKGRTIPLHPVVRDLLIEIAAEREAEAKKTDESARTLWTDGVFVPSGRVFLSSRGQPYSDTRLRGGGNPIARAHATACRRAGIKGFRVHDWRHEWAAKMVMSGCDLVTLMRIGGWSDMRMVQRYASISAEHARTAIAKIA